MAAIGIDLGTTNSVAAHYDKTARILPSDRADGLTPSVVFFRKPRKDEDGEGEILVGDEALNQAYRDPENAIFSIKRLMGRSYDDAKVLEIRERVSYRIVQASDSNDAGVRVLLGGEEKTPVEISALILKQIKESAARALGQPVTHAVITVPAYFEERQRAATRQAGKEAGLIVKKIIDEPSAAAIAYGFTVSQGKRQRLLVFDLGGGTFDVSIIQTVMDPKGKNHFEVLEIRGDNWLGGDDFDNAIVGEIVAAVEQGYGFNPSSDRIFQLLARQAAGRAKITLSNATKADITFPVAYKTPQGEIVDLDLRITRERFNELIQADVDRCMKHVRDALIGQGLTADDIDTVLLVGGSTLTPLVFETVAGYFGREKVQQINPYHSVALGAGILAATLEGIQCPNCSLVNPEEAENCERCGEMLATAASVGSVSMTEVTAVGFGISAVRGEDRDAFEVIIPKGTPYPLPRPKTRNFLTTRENFICIPVYEGVGLAASKNEKQGEILLNEEDFQKEGANVPANTPVEVSMNYTRDRELQIRIRVHGTAIEKELKLNHDRPRQTSSSDAQANAKWREDLEHVVGVAEHFQGKYSQFMEPREMARLDRDIERARQALGANSAAAGEESFNALIVTLDSCGVASLIFLAERVQEGASRERGAKISEAINEVKAGWQSDDKRTVEFLKTPLRAAIAAELNAREAQRKAAGQDDPTDGRLRVLLGAN